MSNLSQTPAISQAFVPTLFVAYRLNDEINKPTGYCVRHAAHCSEIFVSPVDAIEIGGLPAANVRIPERHVRDQVTAEYRAQGAQIYAEGLDIEVCANCHIADGYRAAQLAEVA